MSGATRCRAVAHRGDPHQHPENSLAGIASALRAGADAVEIDVKVTADGEVVLLHDASLQRIWGLDVMITDADRALLDTEVRPHGGAPLLAEALALVGGTGVTLLIDLDHDAWSAPAQAVVATSVADGWVGSAEVAWCGRPEALRVIRALDPDARIVLSWDESNGDPGRADGLPDDAVVQELAPETFNPHWPMVDASVLAWAHERGLQLGCWTVDDPATMTTLIDLGVESMITNRIGLLTALLEGSAGA